MKYNLLLVEDDKYIREIIEDYFSEKEEPAFVVHSAKDGDEGMELIYEQEFGAKILFS